VQVDAAILKLHSRRVCCLAVPASSDSHVLSGDKKGGIAIWNFMQVGGVGAVFWGWTVVRSTTGALWALWLAVSRRLCHATRHGGGDVKVASEQKYCHLELYAGEGQYY
jgi:uncharacterized membrane protein